MSKPHGMKGTRLYRIWCLMKKRCRNNPLGNETLVRYYYDRGIRVCPEWQQFIPFMTWALQNGYKDDLTIDRKDGSLGYFPSNCRWVTMQVQANNHSSGNTRLTWKGRNLTL